jgi:transketolase C-terminal domain/subunit
MVGVDDRFGESGGTTELMAHLNINSDAIINAANAVIKRK